MRWLRVVPGVALIVVAVFVAVTSWSVLVANHPAYPTCLLIALLVGLTLVVTGMRTHQPPRTGFLRLFARLVGAALGVGFALVLLWARPFEATDRGLDAMASDESVTVTDSRNSVRFVPATPAGTGFVIYPGARVDPRAYSVLAHDIAAAGHEVVVLKCPFDIAFLCLNVNLNGIGQAETWAVGGHSLGGVAASSMAGQSGTDAAGLVLWASFPATDLSEVALPVSSVFGTLDGLATPADIEASQAQLPADTEFVPIEGGTHSFFGDYGDQPGDGTPTVTREDAQAQIVEATLALLQR